MAEPVPGIHAEPDINNSRYFHVKVAGPEDVRMNGVSMCYLFIAWGGEGDNL